MEVATTNNHNSTHQHHHHHHLNHSPHLMPPHNFNSNGSGTHSPFQREVREWQRMDPETGALLSGKLEADRWINGPLNSYGKISDSQNISQPNGTQQSQRKQLEVLQSRTPNGDMQVIRTQTVQTSSSSKWSSSSSTTTSSITGSSANNFSLPPSISEKSFAIPSITYPNSKNDINYINKHSRLKNLHNSQFTDSNSLPLPLQLPLPSLSLSPPTWSHLSASPSASGVQISEASDDHDADSDISGYIVDDSETQDNMINGSFGGYGSNGSTRSSSNGSIANTNAIINGNSNSSNNSTISFNALNDNGRSKNGRNVAYERLNSNRSLVDTAPSLKLSNLMKSSSSISNNNSSNNSSTVLSSATKETETATETSTVKATATSGTIASTTMNTHRMPSKISLHAIVGNTNKENHNNHIMTTITSATIPPASMNSISEGKSSVPNDSLIQVSVPAVTKVTPPATWQQQLRRRSTLYEQPDLFGKNNINSNGNSLNKSRVGVTNAAAGTVEDFSESAANTVTVDELYHKRKSIEITPTQLNRQMNQQMRRDLESFRQYNKISESLSANIQNDDDNRLQTHSRHLQSNDLNQTNNDELRLSERQQRRQQTPQNNYNNSLQRSRSISTDDLSTDWNITDTEIQEPGEWRRVSKLRRSFQSHNKNEQQTVSIGPRRPLDLPANLGNVAKIRAELEKKRHENSIKTPSLDDKQEQDQLIEIKPKASKRSTFLTAETLKQIRDNLKQLSNESLYKDDLWALKRLNYQTNEAAEEIKKEIEAERNFRQLSPDQTQEDVTKSAFQVVAQRSLPNGHTTHSLESRQKLKENNSAEWHFRRKSYGFEKMSPPADKTMFRVDASTDSGLGRSGELNNWSPTETLPSKRSTIIQFGDGAKTHRTYESPTIIEQDEYNKRHSIAVDESQYITRTAQIQVNGFNENINEVDSKQIIQQSGFSSTTTSTSTSSSMYQRSQQQKRVEFCKTEVHFAAESGRVNIVETDGKPPPTNNFRRRRRSSVGPLQSLVKSAVTTPDVTDLNEEEKQLRTITSTNMGYKASLIDEPKKDLPSVTICATRPKISYPAGSRHSYTSTSGIDTTDNENDEISSIRGILKNKPVKPKPYHLGENIERPTDLWSGAQLKSVFNSPSSSSPLPELPKTVSERIRQVEKRQDGSSTTTNSSLSTTNGGYSTKINLSLGSTFKQPTEAGRTIDSPRRPSIQELLLQDLREHQRILDEGLKSTSLIIKTMRSANEFDEAMRRLSIASMESTVVPQIVVPTPMFRSNSYQDATAVRRYSNNSLHSLDSSIYKSASYSSTASLSSTIRRYSTDSYVSCVGQPNTPTHLKFLSNTEIPVSQQLKQLRQMYDQHEEDSADEEVKSYFRDRQESTDSGGGTQESSSFEDDRIVEHSNSWSRLKAKRTIWKIENEVPRKEKSLASKEIPKASNVMNIALHSPQTPIKEVNPLNTPLISVPKARPRNLTNVQKSEPPEVQIAQTVNQPVKNRIQPIDVPKNSLKIIKETRGARKLKEHELSYFGVPVLKDSYLNEQERTHLKPITAPRSLINRQNSNENQKPRHDIIEDFNKVEHWQDNSTAPDLIQHSLLKNDAKLKKSCNEIQSMKNEILLNNSDQIGHYDEGEEHFYENISNELKTTFKVRNSPPTNESYNRKTDVQRDALILSEMTRNADQTLKALSDDSALKDQRRRALQRRHSKPLETINEKTFAEKINDKCIAVKVSRGTFSSEARRNSRHSTPSPNNQGRSSSQSSLECPRARSRSISSEREYENIKTKTKTISSSLTSSSSTRQRPTSKITNSRSSSLDSQQSHHSSRYSSDEESLKSYVPRRTPHKNSDKEIKSSIERKHREHQRSSSTVRSSRTERNECLKKEPKEKHSHHLGEEHTARSQHHRRHRRTEDGHHCARSSERPDKIEKSEQKSPAQKIKISSGSRLVRSSRSSRESGIAHRPSNQLERSEKDKDKDKLSRCRGHVSHASSRTNSDKPTSSSTRTASSLKPRENKRNVTSTSSNSNRKETDSQHHLKVHPHPQPQPQHHQSEKIKHCKNSDPAKGHQQGNLTQYGYHQHPMHVHSITTVTTKQRERNGKDRK